jgi:hypothetical protein
MNDFLDLSVGAVLPPAEREFEFDLDSPPPANITLHLRASHHLLARALAEGKPAARAAAISGYSPSSVSRLRADPGFQELVEYYREQVQDIFESFSDRIGALGMSFLDELQRRLEEEPGTFTNEQLRKCAEALLERSIAPAKGGLAARGAGAPVAIAVNVSFAPEGGGAVIEGTLAP